MYTQYGERVRRSSRSTPARRRIGATVACWQRLRMQRRLLALLALSGAG
eukprot:COSAG02_NODE_41323_length_395_cov_14.195946_1_plen_48_part_01